MNKKQYDAQRQRNLYQEKAAYIQSCKNKPCQDCGNEYPPCVMDFDHRNPADKLFNIGSARGRLSNIIAEIAKCDVVCANCHRIRTWKSKGNSGQCQPR